MPSLTLRDQVPRSTPGALCLLPLPEAAMPVTALLFGLCLGARGIFDPSYTQSMHFVSSTARTSIAARSFGGI
jgi:hypothetical protein